MSDVWKHYESVKELAREKRRHYQVNSININLTLIRKIYKQEGIKITFANKGTLRKLKAAYFNDKDGIDVLLNPQLPKEARIFALIHELKHHYLDSQGNDAICLKAYNEEPIPEKAAEVFAAEFIWPQDEFQQAAAEFGLKTDKCTEEDIVRFRRYTNLPVSYKFILKRLEWFRIIQKGQYDKVKFTNLEYKLFGIPFYKRKR